MFRTKSTSKFYLIILGLVVSLVWLTVFSFPKKDFKLIFCNVGQGDAVLLVRGYRQILIDAGPDTKVLDCLAKNMPLFDQKIEMLILTHPDSDHLAGFNFVLDKYGTDLFLSGSLPCETKVCFEVFAKLKQKNIMVKNVFAKEEIKLAEVKLRSLWPEKDWVAERLGVGSEKWEVGTRGNDYTVYQENVLSAKGNETQILGDKSATPDRNLFSLVFLLEIKGKKILLPGDADSRVQDRILSEIFNFQFSIFNLDILKFPHHGSKTGMSEEFLEAIKPKEAVISVGKNSFGHPTSEALDLLKSQGVVVRRTDLEGDIHYEY